MSPEPRLWIGGVLRSAGERILARATGEVREVVQLKAALQRHTAEVTAAASREELLASLGRVLDTAFAVAATQGVSRIELEARLQPAAHSYRVFRHVSQLRSSVARVARDGSLRVTARIHSRRRALEQAAARIRREREPSPPTVAATIIARSTSLQATATVVTQRFLGAPGSSVTHLRSFTRIVPVGSAWTVDAIALRWLRTAPAPALPALIASSITPSRITPSPARLPSPVRETQTRGRSVAPESAKLPTFVLRSRFGLLRSAGWLRRPERQVGSATPAYHTGLTFPVAIPRATGGEFAAWAVSATSRLIVERWLLPYVRRLAAQHVRASKAKLVWEFGSFALPLGLRLLANNPLRHR